MATFRPVTDGAGKEIKDNLDAIQKTLAGQSASAASPSDHTEKQLLTEETGREIASKLADIMTALKSYIAPSSKKVQNKLTIGDSEYDGSAAVTAPNASTSQPGLMSKEDKTKLDGIAANANKYSLPLAANGTRGGVQVGYTQTGQNYPVQLSGEKMYVYVPWTDSKYSLPLAANGTRGGAQIGFAQTGKKYPVQLSSEKMYVEVPWENTTYGEATQSKAGLMSAFDKMIVDALSGSIELERVSWEQISAISKAGKASTMFKVGDEKKITLSTGEEVTAVILGFNHDDLADGSGKAGITFGLKNALKTTYNMNSSSTNAGGWKDSAMRGRMSTFKGYLPSDLQSAIRAVTKKTSAGSQSTAIDSTSDELFLFSHVEVFGTNKQSASSSSAYSVAGEGTQYELYKNARIPEPTSGSGSFSALSGSKGSFYTSNTSNASGYTNKFGESKSTTANYYYNYENAKGLGDDASSANSWWLRSPNASISNYFCYVSSYGNVYTYYANHSHGAVFGFCI